MPLNGVCKLEWRTEHKDWWIDQWIDPSRVVFLSYQLKAQQVDD